MNLRNKPIIELSNVVADSDFTFKDPINLNLYPNENWIIYGANGSGKSQLVNIIKSSYRLISGKIKYDFTNSYNTSNYNNIRCLTFLDQYSSDVTTLPYQMRWNQGTIDMRFEPLLKDYLKDIQKLPQNFVNTIFNNFKISDLSNQTIRSLSSGEFRRFQILQILSKHPQVLILDNPFIGLDEEGRESVSMLLGNAARQLNINIIIVVSKFPSYTQGFTHVVRVGNNTIEKIPLKEFHAEEQTYTETPQYYNNNNAGKVIVDAKNITIRYGQRTILSNLNITIRQGEHWAITGPNGSGKTTLLSLICADNPQGYACDITLFGNKRGSGESIWEIKKQIGYVSPEMFKSYRRNLPTIDIVATGLYDTTGLFKHPKEEEYRQARKWLAIFQISDLENKPYLTLSSGLQRMALLCRAFVKEPSLIILDEPFHGLDNSNINIAKKIITNYTEEDRTRTLIMVSHYKTDFPQIIDHTFNLKRND